MVKWTLLMQVPELTLAATKAALNEAVESGAMICSRLVETTLPGTAGANLIWHLRFETDADRKKLTTSPLWNSQILPILDHAATLDSVVYTAGEGGVRQVGLAQGVYRVRLIRIEDNVPADKMAQFEKEMLDMPGYIDTIRNWSLSRAFESTGPTAWTHVWEQEYESREGFSEAYLNHPYHWGFVDRWYDPEGTDRIVASDRRNVVCQIQKSIIA